jgi:hypothetical protein
MHLSLPVDIVFEQGAAIIHLSRRWQGRITRLCWLWLSQWRHIYRENLWVSPNLYSCEGYRQDIMVVVATN